MADNWIVTVDGQGYGPYSLSQMEVFIGEGRVVPQSLVSRPGSGFAVPANEDPVLALLFVPSSERATAEALPGNSAPQETAKKFGRQQRQEESAGERANIVIIADIKSHSIHGIEEAIFNLGQAYPLLPQVWLLTTDKSAYTIRRLLTPYLGKLDVLFVIDATHDTAAWANFGPEPDSRIRRMWAKPDETERRTG